MGDENRILNTLERLREMLHVISGGEIFFEHIHVPVKDFAEAVRILRELIEKEALKNNVYINLSGGMRILVLETYTASLLIRAKGINVSFTDLELEGSAGVVRLTPLIFPRKFSNTKHKIMTELNRRKTKTEMREISKGTGLSISTVSRTLRELASEGLVRLSKEGKKVLAEITDQGEYFC